MTRTSVRPNAEWLQTDGLGGFASGTSEGIRTRRYHGLLIAAMSPPTGRVMLVNGAEAWVDCGSDRLPLTSHRYAPGVVHPGGAGHIAGFAHDPWPKWLYRGEHGTEIVHELLMVAGTPETILRWTLPSAPREGGTVRLSVRLLFSGRDYHALHHENPAFNFAPEKQGRAWIWTPYAGLPGIAVLANGDYRHDPLWFRRFLYEEERHRGLDAEEDLAAPGEYTFDLSEREAVIVLRAVSPGGAAPSWREEASVYAARVSRRASEPRLGMESALARAAQHYIVRRGGGHSLAAGYPWFTDWGRDTFIAMRGLVLGLSRLDLAEEILLTWADALSEGMLPNRFPETGAAPEYNSVDASLWFVAATHEFLQATQRKANPIQPRSQRRLRNAILAILKGYSQGTRHGIRQDDDGLLLAGEPGVQLTWMDAKVGDWVVTPRIGKPVEVQALWLSALRSAGAFAPEWRPVHEQALRHFQAKFWRDDAGCLYDVVDADRVPGRCDPAFRPNQIFAVGGLPWPLLPRDRAARLVAAVESRLLTPMGLRSLAPDEPGYRGRYEGGVRERDGAYHQGTVWPWLMGAFVEAWLRVHGGSAENMEIARRRFLAPLLAHLDEGGLGHLSEIADGDAPHTPRGCPFQAWSLGELIRMRALLDGAEAASHPAFR